MILKKSHYYLGTWFIENMSLGNVVVIVYKDSSVWRVSLRFRWYRDNKVQNSSDEREHYTGIIPPEHTSSEKEIEEHVYAMLLSVKKALFAKEITYVPIHGDVEKFMFRMAQEKWFHVKKVSLHQNTARQPK